MKNLATATQHIAAQFLAMLLLIQQIADAGGSHKHYRNQGSY
jgi:hypothetical protein